MAQTDLDDDEFTSLLIAAAADVVDAQFLRCKRPKRSTAVAAAAGGPDRPIDVPEGPYMAAIRGTYSSRGAGGAAVGQGSGGSSRLCLTCGGRGHWTNDCSQGGGRGDVPEKACPCGIGICLVLTSSTAKNSGRKFYRCPQPDSGGCHYFDWCDSPSSASPTFPAPRGAPTPESDTRGAPTHESNTRGAPSYESDSTVPNVDCLCGVGPCLVLTSRTTKYAGRQFYSCPNKEEDQSCNFCIWCDEYTSADARPT